MIQLKAYEHTFNSPEERELTKQTWIDLYETEPIKLTLSIEDITNADATSTFSKSFKVPGTRINAEFFNNSFDVDGVMFDVTVKKPAEILVDGAEFKQGHIRLQRVYLNTELDRYDYELVFLGETRDFSSKIADKSLCQLQLNDVIGGASGGGLTAADIQLSWQAYPQGLSLADGLHNGDIIYPLIDHGNTYNDSGTPEQAEIRTGPAHGGKPFTQNSHPLSIDRFKPMIRAKRIWDKIFEDAGYTYTSSFITSDLFHQMYISAFGNEATINWDAAVSSVNSNNICHAQNNANAGSILEAIILPQGINDPGSNLGVANSFTYGSSSFTNTPFTYYEVPSAGEYQIAGQCYYSGYNESSDGQPIYQATSLKLLRLPAGSSAADLVSVAESNTGSGQGDTLQFNVTIPSGILGPGDRIFLFLGDPSSGGYQIDNFFTQNFALDVIAAPGDYNPVTSLECVYKQIDFIKDMLTAFRLVLSPDPNNVQNFIVEPWQQYINSGDLYDWSDKLVEDKDVQIEPVFFSQVDEVDFKFQLGGDFTNIYHQQAYSEPYGWLQFNSNNDLLIGKKDIKLNGIAPTEIVNVEGSDAANKFIIPQLHTHSADDVGLQHLPIKPKTRFLFYNGLKSTNGITWNLQGASPQGQTVYPLVSPYETFNPVVPATLNLNWANDVKYYSAYAGLEGTWSTLYDNYWSRYMSFLYGKYSRRVTAFFVLNNVDLNTFSFDDTIFVNGTYYRPEKIIDVEIGAYTQVKVQLLTANDYKPNIIPFQTLLECSAVGVASLCALDQSEINVTTNGTPGFTWTLSNGMAGSAINGGIPGQAPYYFTIPNVPPGTWTLEVTDSLGRTKTLTVVVPASTATVVTATSSVTPASDCNVCDGTIIVTPAGGTGPYTIEWYDGPSTSFTRTDLCVGQYSYTVYDSFGCAQQSYVTEVTCEQAPGVIWEFWKSSADCTQILIAPQRRVFYPQFVAPPTINAFYRLTDLNGLPLDGCWTPVQQVATAADALESTQYQTCASCQGTTTDNYLVRNCITGTTYIVTGVPGIAIGQFYFLTNIKGCYEVMDLSPEISDATIYSGPYGDCSCTFEPIGYNYQIDSCDGSFSHVVDFGGAQNIGDIVVMSDGYCYQINALSPSAPTSIITFVDGGYQSCLDCEQANPLPTDLCVTNFGASMAPCTGGTVDDYMEGYVDLSGVTPVLAQFTIKVFYIPGSPAANCNNPQNEIELHVEVEAGQSQGVLTCPQAPFIDFNGATICSSQFIDGPYPLCTQPVFCNEYTIGGYDQGCTIYLNCDGIQEEACYNGPAASGYDQTSFCATEIITFYGAEPSLTGLCPY